MVFLFVLSYPFLLEMLALHHITPPDKKYWSHAALIFTTVYAVFVAANYAVQLATIIPMILSGAASKISILVQTPHSLFGDFDAIGYISLAIATFASTLIAPKIVSVLGKKYTYLFASLWGTGGYIVLRFFGMTHPYIYIAIIVVSVLGAGTNGPIRQAMYMDAAEYGFYKTGRDASAFIMSMFTLPIKIAIALAGTIVTAGLDLIGYVPNIAPSEQFINNLMNLICYLPAGAGFLAFAIMIFYSLSDDRLAEIMEVNDMKRDSIKSVGCLKGVITLLVAITLCFPIVPVFKSEARANDGALRASTGAWAASDG